MSPVFLPTKNTVADLRLVQHKQNISVLKVRAVELPVCMYTLFCEQKPHLGFTRFLSCSRIRPSEVRTNAPAYPGCRLNSDG